MRPEALWLLVPLIAAIGLWLYRGPNKQHKIEWIDAELVDYMLEQQPKPISRWWTWLLIILTVGLILAISGPSFKKIPQPVNKNQDALVVLLDMSLSMNAEDIKPSRAIRVKQKTIDIIRQRQDGQTAIIAYSGLAHTVSPFTDDIETIEHLISALSPDIMPKLGSRPDKAIELAAELVSAGGFKRAQALLITDGIQLTDITRIKSALNTNIQLSVITIGTEQGAPIRLADNSFLKDGRGNIILPSLSIKEVDQLSSQLGIPTASFSFTDDDWQSLLSNSANNYNLISSKNIDEQSTQQKQDEFDQWLDQGFWLALVIMPLMLLLFRPGFFLPSLLAPMLSPLITPIIGSTLLVVFIFDSEKSYADTQPKISEPSLLEQWFTTRDRQASKRFETQPELAAELFNDPQWKAQALYESQQFDKAEQLFKQDPSAHGRYNLGNSLARQGKYLEALENYQAALDLNPSLESAKINKQRVEEWLEQQSQRQPQQQPQNSENEQQRSDDNSAQNSQQQNSQSGSQNNSDNQPSNTQNDDPQKNDQQQDDQQNQQGSKQDREEDPSDESASSSSSNIDQFDDNAEISSNGSSQKVDQSVNDLLDKEKNEDLNKNQESSPSESLSNLSANDNQNTANQGTLDSLSREQQAALQNSLNRVEDTPGTLLQRKFLYQYRQDQDQQDEDLLW